MSGHRDQAAATPSQRDVTDWWMLSEDAMEAATSAATDDLVDCECGCVRMSCKRGDLLRCADCGRVWPGAEPTAATVHP